MVVAPLRWVHHPKFRAVLFRATFDDLERSLGERTEAIYPIAFPGARYNRSAHTWTFPSGAKIYLRYLRTWDDALSHKSQEYQFIGFDELTSFVRKVYVYLTSRLRSAHGLPIRLRAASNPGDKGHEWVFERWGAWLNPEHKNPAKPGEVRWYTKAPGTDEEIEVPMGTPGARGRAFIPASIADNPSLLNNDPDYQSRLDELDPVERARLKHGDWTIRPAAGLYFKREWVDFIDAEFLPSGIRWVRNWDLAATLPKPGTDPDWTAGVKLGIHGSDIYVADVVRRRDNPGAIEKIIKATAELDGSTVPIGIPQDPGQAGKSQVAQYVTALAGFTVLSEVETGDKGTRLGPFSTQAEHRRVKIVRGPWNNDYVYELEAFPTKGVHDDQVDATSGAYRRLIGGAGRFLAAMAAYEERE